MTSPLNQPVKLPCGLVLPNRLVKAAMAEQLAKTDDHSPNDAFHRAYSQWAEGGWGALLTGNVQVDINHLGTPNDAALSTEYSSARLSPQLLSAWKQYASMCQTHGTPTIVQVCHPGRQSMRGAGLRGLFEPTIAPSAVPLNLGAGWLDSLISSIAFGMPREMTQPDIERVTRQFVDAARLMADSGFAGIELHGAHGYLIDQFLNPKTNLRTDAYGGSAEKHAKFLLDILRQCRNVVPSTFCIGVKLNSADHSASNFEDTMTQIGLLVDAGIDFLEISGGSYEDPKMVYGSPSNPSNDNSLTTTPKTSGTPGSTAAREAFFLEFATETRRRYPSLVLMLTGGFRSRSGAEAAIREKACDLIGIARPAAVNPSLPHLLLDESVPDEEARLALGKVRLPWLLRMVSVKAVGAGAESTYYQKQIHRLAKGLATFAPAV